MHGQETMFTPPSASGPTVFFNEPPSPPSLSSRAPLDRRLGNDRDLRRILPPELESSNVPLFSFSFLLNFISNTGACAPTLPPQHGTSTRHSISPAVSVRGRKYDISARGSTTLVVVSGKNSPRVFFYSIATSYIQGKQFRRGLPYLPSKPSIVSKSSCQASIIPLFCHDVIRPKEK